MKKHMLALATATLLGGGSQAGAADLGGYIPPPALYNWSGAYIGAHAGYLWGDIDWNLGPGIPTSINPDGFLGGGLVGYNFQYDSFVFGIESDFSIGDLDEGPGTFSLRGLQSANINYIVTLRGRIGYAFDNWLLYATGGVGFADVDLYDSATAPPNSANETLVGYVIGGGVEADLGNLFGSQGGALSGRLEYMYGNYDEENFNLGAVADSADLETHVVRAALVYRFGGLF